jgi:hypothetical protein
MVFQQVEPNILRLFSSFCRFGTQLVYLNPA